MTTPPPAVPGIAHANSSPPSPASRARWRHTAFVAPPPATRLGLDDLDRRELAFEPEHERVDAGVRRRAGWSRARRPGRRDPRHGRNRSASPKLCNRARARERSGGTADADRGQPRERDAVFDRRHARKPFDDRAGNPPRLAHTERHDHVSRTRPRERQRNAHRRASAPSLAASDAARRPGRACRSHRRAGRHGRRSRPSRPRRRRCRGHVRAPGGAGASARRRAADRRRSSACGSSSRAVRSAAAISVGLCP